MHEGHGKVVFIFVLIVALIAFAVFFAIQFARDRDRGTATSTPAVATSTAVTATTTERLGFIRRFFKLLGYDFDAASRPRQQPPSTSSGQAPRPAVVQRPPPPTGGSQPPPSRPPAPLPYGFTEADRSPYYGQITISSVSHPDLSSLTAFRNSYSEVRIRADVPAGELVNITLWRVKSSSGSFLIPKANDVLPAAAYANPDDIRVRRGDTVRIFSRRGPVVLNFRLNACTGYYAALGFVPSVPRSCPLIYENRSELAAYSGDCQDYVLKLSRCELPSSQPPIKYSDSQCFDLLRRASYDQCLARHRNDPNFLGSEWRVWLGNPSNEQVNIFHPKHDRALLFDQDGKVVDEYIY